MNRHEVCGIRSPRSSVNVVKISRLIDNSIAHPLHTDGNYRRLVRAGIVSAPILNVSRDRVPRLFSYLRLREVDRFIDFRALLIYHGPTGSRSSILLRYSTLFPSYF